jgi:hypothetical protein
MTTDTDAALAQVDNGVSVVLSLEFQADAWLKIGEVDPAIDFGLNDAPVHLVAKVPVRYGQTRSGIKIGQ